ncbi:MAG: hypothetical protein MK097_06945 [Dechloromonas sp.]|nr:hypothetical protein [Dechloromonas sp.]
MVEAAFRMRMEAMFPTIYMIGANGRTTPPDDGREFVVIQYPVHESSRPMLTKRRFEEGAARIVYNAKSGTELASVLTQVDAIAAAFRGDRLKFDGVEVFEPNGPIVNDENDDGNYFETAVIVPYRYQFDVAS